MGDKWTELKLLSEKDIDSCIDVKNEMVSKFEKKPYAFNFLTYRSNDLIKEFIKKQELYGIFDKNTNEMLSFNIVEQVSTDSILNELKNNNEYLISKSIINILKPLKGCYVRNLVTRLRPNICGIGKHFINTSNKYIKNKLNCDFRVETININNTAMYRLYTNNSNDNNKFSFGCNIVEFDKYNIKKEKFKNNFIYIITLLNQDTINSLKSIIEVDNRYKKDTISNLANKINNKENILLIEGTKAEVYRVKE